MLSIGRVSRGQIGYYTKQVARGDGVRAATYYQRAAEPPGQWVGTGAAMLGLTCELTEGALETLLDGAHPVTTEPLGRPPQQTLGLDLTFSAPKSVSMLAYLLDDDTHREVTAAHAVAVAAALAWLQDEAAVVRRGSAGAEEHRAQGLIGARFDHATSRDLDPQLHSHVVVSSLAQGPDGRYTQLHARQLYRCAATAGHLYQATLRAELTARLGVSWAPVIKGQAEIAGVSEDARKEFSSRRQAIEAEQAHILAAAQAENARRITEGKPPLPLPHGRALWEQATLASRRAKDHHAAADLAALVPQWQERARTAGLDVDAPRAYLAGLQAVSAPARTTWEEVTARLAGPDGLTADRAWVDRRDIIQAVAAELHRLEPGVVRPGESAATAAVRLADAWCASHGVALHTSERADQETGRWALRFTTTQHLQRELDAMLLILSRQAETVTGLGDPATAQRLVTELGLGEEQAAAVRALTRRGAGVDVLSAPAGAGKTTLLAAAVSSWQDAGYTVIGTSTAAKAVRELAASAGIDDARTLAALLKHLADGYRVEQRPGEDGRPRRVRVPFAFTDRHVLVVDEAAMTSTRDLHTLARATTDAGTKLVLIGDPRQLPSIKAGGLMATAMRELDNPARTGLTQPRTTRLAETRRATEQWERDAQLDWHAGRIDEALTLLEAHGRVHYGTDADSAHVEMLVAWQQLRTELAADTSRNGESPAPEPLMVAHRRAHVHALNQAARDARVAAGEIDASRYSVTTVDLGPGGTVEVEIAVGEPVITTIADRQAGVINGSRGIVTAVHDSGLTMRTDGGTDVHLDADYLAAGGLLHAYALTAHRAQGTTAPAALVLVDTSSMTTEWGYSAATRGRRNDLFVFTPPAEPTDVHHGPSADQPTCDPANQRSALLAAMGRRSDQISALDTARDDGVDLLATLEHSEAEELGRVPTEADYQQAARLATVAAYLTNGERPTQEQIDQAAVDLAGTRSDRAETAGLAAASAPSQELDRPREADQPLQRDLSRRL